MGVSQPTIRRNGYGFPPHHEASHNTPPIGVCDVCDASRLWASQALQSVTSDVCDASARPRPAGGTPPINGSSHGPHPMRVSREPRYPRRSKFFFTHGVIIAGKSAERRAFWMQGMQFQLQNLLQPLARKRRPGGTHNRSSLHALQSSRIGRNLRRGALYNHRLAIRRPALRGSGDKRQSVGFRYVRSDFVVG